jgi:hypothetical protein
MFLRFHRPALLSLVVVSAVLAQSTGTIQGTVTDPSGAAVPKANVTVRNVATGQERSFTTEESGLYIVPSLAVGRYQVSVSAPGLQTTTISDLVLEVGRSLEQNFHLQVASATEVVEIVGTAPVVESSSVSVGSVIDQRTVQEIPLNGRHFVDLGMLAPGSVAPPAVGYLTAALRGQGSFAFFTAGNREDTVNFMINGINLNDMLQNQITFQPRSTPSRNSRWTIRLSAPNTGEIPEPSSTSPLAPAPTIFMANCLSTCAIAIWMPAIISIAKECCNRRSSATSSAPTEVPSGATTPSSSSATRACGSARD